MMRLGILLEILLGHLTAEQKHVHIYMYKYMEDVVDVYMNNR